VPDGLQQIVDWMMAKQPEQRYATPERAAQALAVYLLADSAPAQRLEDAPHMRSFLTWLETSEASEAVTVMAPEDRAAAAAPPVSTPQPAGEAPGAAVTDANKPSIVETTEPAAAEAATRAAKRTKKPGAGETLLAAPYAPPPAASEFDIHSAKTIIAPDAAQPPSKPARRRLGVEPRDWILLGIGAAAMLLFFVVALVIVLLLR
jgi:hypothetical protein